MTFCRIWAERANGIYNFKTAASPWGTLRISSFTFLTLCGVQTIDLQFHSLTFHTPTTTFFLSFFFFFFKAITLLNGC